MALKADRDGFLVGEPITIDRDSFAKAVNIWRAIQGDTAALRESLLGDAGRTTRSAVVSPGRGAANGSAFTDKQVVTIGEKIAAAIGRKRRNTATPERARGADGRFKPESQAARPAIDGSDPAASNVALPQVGVQAPSQAIEASVVVAAPAPVAAAPSAAAPSAAEPIASPAPGPSAAPSAVAPVGAPATPAIQRKVASKPPAANRTRSRAETPERGKNGRFKGGDDESPDRGGSGGSGGGFESLSEAAANLRDTASGLADTAEAVDPTVTAAKELGGIVAPILSPVGGLLKKGFGALFRRDDDSIPWYRRIHGELREINKKSGAKGGGGLLSRLNPLNLLKMLPGAGLLSKGASMLARGVGSLLGKGGLGMLSKLALPVGAMISAFKSFNTSTEEYASRLGVELNGGLAQELGVRFVGVLGDLGNTLTFGLAGKFGEFIAPVVSDTFTAIGATWDSAVEKFNGITSGIGKSWDDTLKWFKESIDKSINKVVEVKDAVVESVAEVKDSASTWVADKVDAVASSVGKGSAGNRKALIGEMVGSGITDKKEQAAFLAQMDHESGGFKRLDENLNYSAEGLLKTFPKYYKNAEEAKADARNPEAIANKVYGGRMGNTEAGDGYKFRGRGFTQLTGKANYAEASKALGVDLVNNPDLAADPAVAAKVSSWYWKKSGAGDAARAGDLRKSRKLVNGGYNGMSDVQQKYDSYMTAMNTGVIDTTGKPQAVAKSNKAMPTAPMVMASAQAPQAVTSAGMTAPTVPTLLAPMPKPASARVAAPSMLSMAPAPASAPGPAPAVQTPIGSNNKGGNRTEVKLTAPISQNLSDRSIAHVATGGIGGG